MFLKNNNETKQKGEKDLFSFFRYYDLMMKRKNNENNSDIRISNYRRNEQYDQTKQQKEIVKNSKKVRKRKREEKRY